MENLRQTRKVGVAGGFINQMMGNNSSNPKVGEGATELFYSDRSANEVTWVSEDGLSCKIRTMNCKFTGSGYGDERYTYSSNVDAYERTLSWNDKKKCWGVVTFEVKIIKSLLKKLYKEFGYKLWENLPNGLTSDDLYEKTHEDNYYNKMKVIPGVTKEYRNFDKISIIFGVMEEYRDPHF